MTETLHENKSPAEKKTDTDQENALAELAGTYMTFRLDEETYGLEVLMVREIIRIIEFTRVPRTREYIRGVINLRGKVIPVLDMKMKFGMGRTEITDYTVIIVVNGYLDNREITMGILVDEVLEVVNIEEEQVQLTPDFAAGALDAEFIIGIGKMQQSVVFLLDIIKILARQDAIEMAQVVSSIEAETSN